MIGVVFFVVQSRQHICDHCDSQSQRNLNQRSVSQWCYFLFYSNARSTPVDASELGMSTKGPKVMAGTLLTTDIPTKQLIMYLDRENDNNIIIQDLDDTHVFVNSQYVDYVKENVAALLETNMFERRDLEGR